MRFDRHWLGYSCWIATNKLEDGHVALHFCYPRVWNFWGKLQLTVESEGHVFNLKYKFDDLSSDALNSILHSKNASEIIDKLEAMT